MVGFPQFAAVLLVQLHDSLLEEAQAFMRATEIEPGRGGASVYASRRKRLCVENRRSSTVVVDPQGRRATARRSRDD